MAKSIIQTVNQSTQAVAVNSIIALGSVARRYGCNLQLSGNAIEVGGEGYYAIDAEVTVAPTVAGNVTVAMFVDGVQVPGAIAYGSVGTADDPITLPITATIRRTCCCESVDSVSFQLLEGAGNVNNISVRIAKL